MTKFHGAERVGLRDRDTNKLIAVYPYKLEEGDYDMLEAKVRNWYYEQSCDAEDRMRNYYVDALTESELKQLKQQ